MRIEDLTVALRPRTAWEAVELGTALTRRHLGAVLRPWLAVTLPVWLALNLLCGLIDAVWLAGLLMWWLKPVFDRVPLFVLSRAVFGRAPGTVQTVRAQFDWGWRWMGGYLTWRRLSPLRSLNLPVDLLEGGQAQAARTRRNALGSPVYGVASLLTLVFVHFELALFAGTVSAALLFVPNDILQEAAARMYNVFVAQPLWLQVGLNAIAWLVVTVLEPFYIGAGFGLYLNRRTQIEGWDIEMALRRLHARLTQVAAPVLVALALGLSAHPAAHAAPSRADADTVGEVFGEASVRDPGWKQAVKRAYEDPSVRPRRTVKQWELREPRDPKPERDLGDFGRVLGLIGEYGLWVIFGVLVLALLITAPRWLGWLRATIARERREDTPVEHVEAAPPEPLPPDVPAAALRLWEAGHERDALALLYRASVEAMARRAQIVLVPGATEAHTLRASRRMPRAQDREVFARTVRTWQIAAYAHGLPTAQEFESLLGALAHSFQWPTSVALGAAPEASA